MNTAIGLERLPHQIHLLLDEATTNLVGAANELDVLVQHGSAATLQAIEFHEGEGDRIVHELISVVSASRRAGPDRDRVIALAQAIDDVVDAVNELGWAWARRPLGRLRELVLGVRDTARASAHVVRAFEHPTARDQALDRCREARRDANASARAARVWLLVEQNDPVLAVAGHHLLGRAEACLDACARLCDRVERHELA